MIEKNSLEVGRVLDSGLIWIGFPPSATELITSGLSKLSLRACHLTEADARWLVRALQAELCPLCDGLDSPCQEHQNDD